MKKLLASLSSAALCMIVRLCRIGPWPLSERRESSITAQTRAHPARFFLQKEPRQMDAASLSPAQVGDDAILAL
jgi:hypothetical protein